MSARRAAGRSSGAARPARANASLLRGLTADARATDPAMLFATCVAAAAVVLLVTTLIQDTDLWTLLAQGRAIVSHPALVKVNQWTWTDFGAPQIASSWLFRVVLWPFWAAGGVGGVFAWRWLSALAVFGLLYATARRLRARGLLTLLVLVACAMVYRTRADARPESLAAILFALSVWILETRRAGGPDRALWLIPVALVWANAHLSVFLLPVLMLFHALPSLFKRESQGARRPRALWPVMLAVIAVVFVQPSGWRAVWQPFQFAFFWRHDPMFGSIEELQPLAAALDWRSGMPVLVALWPIALVARVLVRRTRIDVTEALSCVFFSAAIWSSLRFTGVWAMAATPYLARDLSDLLVPPGDPSRAGGRDERVVDASVSATAPRWGPALAIALACAGLAFAEASRADRPFGVGIEMRNVPEHACDYMRDAGVRGRGFNHMQHGGYMAWRFWPDRTRLPFVTTQPELSTAAVRASYIAALQRPAEWYALDQARHFDYVLLQRRQDPGDHLLDVLDQDSSWVMVFADDAAELYVPRGGALDSIAARDGYRVIPGGRDGRARLVPACEADTALRARAPPKPGAWLPGPR